MIRHDNMMKKMIIVRSPAYVIGLGIVMSGCVPPVQVELASTLTPQLAAFFLQDPL